MSNLKTFKGWNLQEFDSVFGMPVPGGTKVHYGAVPGTTIEIVCNRGDTILFSDGSFVTITNGGIYTVDDTRILFSENQRMG